VKRTRIIPVLLIDSTGGLVKTVRFGKRTYLGDPINAVRIFNQKRVDELFVLDIDATTDSRQPNMQLIEDIASQAFMPVAYGGGLSSVDDMSKVFSLGVEKVVFSSLMENGMGVIQEASKRFGAQALVGCLDYRRLIFRGEQVLYGGRRRSGKPVRQLATELADNGVGELLVQAITRDGSYEGYDLTTIKSVVEAVSIPVIACGGASSLDDMGEAVRRTGCHAVAAASMFVYRSQGQGVLISHPDKSEVKKFHEHIMVSHAP
jgi:imidazole glycerol-phosphate synthase subunit HisF